MERFLVTTRREVEQRKIALRNGLLEDFQSGILVSGQILPPVRELAERYHLSLNVVREVVQQFVEQGVLYTIPRVGTFVGQRPVRSESFYLLVLPADVKEAEQSTQLQMGFEERVAQLGGASIVTTLDRAIYFREQGTLPALTGVFDYSYPDQERGWIFPVVEGVPWVRFFGEAFAGQAIDTLTFDDCDGGRQAAQFLLNSGHRQIAFLALHCAEGDPGVYRWSAEREQGWRLALSAAGIATERLAFHSAEQPKFYQADQIRVASQTAQEMLARTDITAVVAANDSAALGLFAALRDAEAPHERWPAVVGFDNLPGAHGFLLTSLRLPWEEIGRAGADLIFERAHRQLIGPPQHRRVPLRLLPRLTTRSGWTKLAGASVFTASEPG